MQQDEMQKECKKKQLCLLILFLKTAKSFHCSCSISVRHKETYEPEGVITPGHTQLQPCNKQDTFFNFLYDRHKQQSSTKQNYKSYVKQPEWFLSQTNKTPIYIVWGKEEKKVRKSLKRSQRRVKNKRQEMFTDAPNIQILTQWRNSKRWPLRGKGEWQQITSHMESKETL